MTDEKRCRRTNDWQRRAVMENRLSGLVELGLDIEENPETVVGGLKLP